MRDTGTLIKKFEKGFGFIAIDADGDVEQPNLFVHYKNVGQELWDEIRIGSRLEFDVERCPKGLEAQNVRPAPPLDD